MMNELQKCQLHILCEYIKICEKLGLRYFMVCGSCLGAVKYHGFIPWDDDVDVAMLRGDYETFLTEAPKLLPEYLFLQNYKSDPEVPFLYSKLRDSRTTMIEKSVSKLHIHHGVYIDVFPLDGYPDKNAERFERKKLMYGLQNLCAYENDVKRKTRWFLKAERALGFHRRTVKTNQKRDRLLTAYPPEQSKLWCNFGNWQGKLEYAPREQYGEGTDMLFEGITVRVPQQYDAYLTQKYGDWRADLTEEEKQSHHNVILCDLEKPYTMFRD